MLDHGRGVELRVTYAAVTARLAADSVLYEVLPHGSRAVSLLCHHHRNHVGLTLWPSGDAEMTWAMDAGGDDIEHYEILTQSNLDHLLRDLRRRLGH